MPIEHRALLRFMILYSALFSAFGLASPFLPAFLAGRGLDSEQVGFVLGLATATRLVCGPIALVYAHDACKADKTPPTSVNCSQARRRAIIRRSNRWTGDR
jgi:hypothetical protein